MESILKIALPKRWAKLLFGAGAVIALGLYFAFDPSMAGFFPPCPVKKFTGLECPGCGSQRALHALLHLHFADAFRFNPLAFTAILFLVYDRLAGKGPLRHPHAPWIVLVIVILYWMLRNVSFYPF
ncbi:uncharacterized protein DUF2752 [Anseongella ginsenosidimutans]|uniref:Uncharacterized protein DUF2752 n=1 Tax=Anseongella ginsenosidimutans TaxID=496056 RepID=A0A4R3KQ17_9SPHI|nr:DUF2752 domain-containing protein [Anseongella ginsenosidimutans]TCS86554.1 uncharacterized protein DUF2752 [Anseongella ginsenosidimutans]